MSRQKKQKIATSGGEALHVDNPFAALSAEGLPEAAPPPAESAPATRRERRQKGPAPRLNLRRLKAGKGGKTVTEISGFIGVNDQQLADLAKSLKAACGVGGTVKGRSIEIQGDQRETLVTLLEARGYRVVLSGG